MIINNSSYDKDYDEDDPLLMQDRKSILLSDGGLQPGTTVSSQHGDAP